MELQSVQDNIVKVFKANMNHSEILQSIEPFIDIFALIEELFPKPLFNEYCIETMKSQYSKVNLANLSNEELLREMFPSTTTVLYDVETHPKKFKKNLGRRYGQFIRKCKRNLARFKHMAPFLEKMKQEHERQAKELKSFLRLIKVATRNKKC